jgi:CMD domain protein
MSAQATDGGPDTIDAVAGLAPDSPVAALRRQRPEILRLSQLSEEAALRPRDEGGFDRNTRAALACRMARHLNDGALVAHYAAMLMTAEEKLTAVPQGSPAPETDARLAAILRHVDLVTLTPGRATRDDIEALRRVGLTEADIVTLSGIIAFVNYQARVAAGLRMLKGE